MTTPVSTRVEEERFIQGQESIQYIRPITLSLTIIQAKPGARLNVFFSGENVTDLCYTLSLTTPNPSITSPVIDFGNLRTDALGQANIILELPGGTFPPGQHEIIVTDAPSLDLIDPQIYGSARGTFYGAGVVTLWQRVITETVTNEIVVDVPDVDPLAQSFFTHGMTDGVFISSIEVFFKTKAEDVPVRCEIRPLVNGYPGPADVHKNNLISVVNAENVVLSDDASEPTKFVFDPPVYVRPNADYCFVLRSNSNQYNVFTSKLGETSYETGRAIFQQPYIGSLFKSENNITWSAEQFEDIKFNINKCVFNTSETAVLKFIVKPPPVGALGRQFTTTSGLNSVIYHHNHDHGLDVGDTFSIINHGYLLDAGVKVNGIPIDEFEGDHTVLEKIDSKTIRFNVTSAATASGELLSSSVIHVHVSSGGSSYQASDTIVTNTPTSPLGSNMADLELQVTPDNKVRKVIINDPGYGYREEELSVSISSVLGFGAVLHPIMEPSFTVRTNKPYTKIIPNFNIKNYGQSTFSTDIETVIGNYEGGSLPKYAKGASVPLSLEEDVIDVNQCSIICSDENNTTGARTTYVNVDLLSDNPNYSPVLSIKHATSVHAFYPSVSHQGKSGGVSAESRQNNVTDSTGSIESLVIIDPGSGYTPGSTSITISPPDISGGTQATATVSSVASGGHIDGIDITDSGSGYLKPPTVTVTRTGGTGNNAILIANLTPFNSELTPNNGTAKARYISKKLPLQNISSGIRLFSVIASTEHSYVDWYLRTSLSSSGVDHETLEWKKMICDIERNRSNDLDEFLEYEFRLDDLEPFDVYDLKCVLGAENPLKAPMVKSYRVIAIA